jgi:hypothetical protein
MKKLVIALAAVGVVLALRPVLKRKAHSKMREHCKQMAAKCKQMMAQYGGGEEGEMPEHCKEMAAKREEKLAQVQAGHETPVPEHSEPTVVAHGDRSSALSTA